jgi:hypothetical protein
MKLTLAVAAALAASLVACSPAASHEASSPAHYGPAYVVGGHVTGLRGIGLSLRGAGGEEVDVTDDGKFVFGALLPDGAAYDVAISREPISPVQSCTVTHGAGKIAGRSAMTIDVVCTTATFDDPRADDALASR